MEGWMCSRGCPMTPRVLQGGASNSWRFARPRQPIQERRPGELKRSRGCGSTAWGSPNRASEGGGEGSWTDG
eukprot:996111-Pyramimonas_sp.AAC.2